MNYAQIRSVPLEVYSDKVGLGITQNLEAVVFSDDKLFALNINKENSSIESFSAPSLRPEYSACIANNKIIAISSTDTFIYNMLRTAGDIKAITESGETVAMKDRHSPNINGLVFHGKGLWGIDSVGNYSLYRYSANTNDFPEEINLYGKNESEDMTIAAFGTLSNRIAVLGKRKSFGLRLYDPSKNLGGAALPFYPTNAGDDSLFASYGDRIYITNGNLIDVYDAKSLKKKMNEPIFTLELEDINGIVSIAAMKSTGNKKILAAIVRKNGASPLELRIFEESQKNSKKK